jgi:hypothetical protein
MRNVAVNYSAIIFCMSRLNARINSRHIFQKMVIVAELSVALLIITADIALATILLLLGSIASLLLRKQKMLTLGFRKFKHWKSETLKIFGLTIAWTIITLGLVAPVLSHLFGLQENNSAYASLQGDIPQMLGLLVLSWTIVVFGEEIVYRSFIPGRVSELFSNTPYKYAFSVVISSLFFGLAHSEAGWAGMIISAFNGVFYSLIRKYFSNNLWASVFAHGFSNTIGIVGFFIIGPISSLW